MVIPVVNSEWAIADDTDGVYMRVIKVTQNDGETLVTFKLMGNDKDAFAAPLTMTLEEFWHDARPMPEVELTWWQRVLDFFGGF